MEETSTGKITQALCNAITHIGTVQKTGYNAFHKYHYASDTDIKRAVQPAFAMNGLAIRPLSVISLDGSGENKSHRLDLVIRWRLSHSSGEWMDFEVPSTGMDSGDKAVYKAITGNIKYALAQICIIPTDDDAERDSPSPSRQKRGGKMSASPPPVPREVSPPTQDDDWPAHQKAFCASIGDLGFNYDAVCHLCEHLKRPRPSQMPDDQRLKLLAYLATNDAKLKMSDLEAT